MKTANIIRLAPGLFREAGADMHDFEIWHYEYFLDRTESLAGLLYGLRELAPFADDALAVAETMDEEEFQVFKKALTEKQPIIAYYEPIIMPRRFVMGDFIAKKFQVSLGVALLALAEFQEHAEQSSFERCHQILSILG